MRTPFAALLLALSGCASAAGAPAVSETVLRFDSPDALDAWVVTGGEWRVADGRLIGRSLDPSGHRTEEFATYGTYFGEIERVTVRGGLDASSPHNFRMAVGSASQLFDWELADANWFNYGRFEQRVEGAALRPGREHEIVVEQVGPRIRVVVDDRLLWEREGRLHGTVCFHPTIGSTLWVREVVIRGRPVPWVTVTGPSAPPL